MPIEPINSRAGTMCQDLINHDNRVSMGVTPIRIRTKAKVGGTIRIIRTMDGETIRIACHLPK